MSHGEDGQGWSGSVASCQPLVCANNLWPNLPMSRGDSSVHDRKPAVWDNQQLQKRVFGLPHQVSGRGPLSCPHLRPLPWGSRVWEPLCPCAATSCPEPVIGRLKAQGPSPRSISLLTRHPPNPGLHRKPALQNSPL